jgi:two-component system OmpR family sensor kinase
MFQRLSIRARITLGSVIVAAILLAGALLVVRAQMATILADADATLAQNDLTSFEKDITAHPGERVDDPGTGVLVLIRDPSGDPQVNTLPHDVMEVVSHRDAADDQFTFTDDERRTYVIVGRAVTTTDGTWALWAARSTSASELALEGLDHVLLIGGGVLLVGLGLASWILATVALRPVTAMRRRAEHLSEDDAHGELPVGTAQDELADLARTLNHFLERVHTSSAREKQMVSDAAHELRTPLAALKTQLELAHGDFGDADALARQVRSAEASVDRLSSLASNLLELSRLEAHDGSGSSSFLMLVDEFTGSIDRGRAIALGKGVTVDFELSVFDESERYAIDAQAFGRLTDNLLSNAISAVETGGTVTADITQSPDALTLTVSDDGPGMPAEFLPIAFERFTRPDASRTSSTGGSGLGLALVSALARDAGGEATAHNTSPGLRVTVRLPKM